VSTDASEEACPGTIRRRLISPSCLPRCFLSTSTLPSSTRRNPPFERGELRELSAWRASIARAAQKSRILARECLRATPAKVQRSPCRVLPGRKEGTIPLNLSSLALSASPGEEFNLKLKVIVARPLSLSLSLSRDCRPQSSSRASCNDNEIPN